MLIIKSIPLLRKIIRSLRQKNKTIGFVPTMGALHEGHLVLIRKAKKENAICILSIFVNPKQFGPKEDFKSYPREKNNDKKLAEKEDVDIIFYPSMETIYPSGYLTSVEVDRLSSVLCGKFRPGHFKGVTTIVAKLLNIIIPDIFYLGQKDAQQVIILKKMVADLNFPVRIKTCPTVREKDGLALSSRNRYLSPLERKKAPVLYRSLKLAKQKILSGQHDTKKITQFMSKTILHNGGSSIDYIECVNADSLFPLKQVQGKIMLALAVRFGKVRLIDNIIFHVP